MARYDLPEAIRGEWIWSRRTRNALESYVFFRREFSLLAAPASAELWLTAKSLFHVYVNGRHLGLGPPVCPLSGSYVSRFDASSVLRSGANVVSILAHNTRVVPPSSTRKPSGLWCQLNAEGKPIVWSDKTWLMAEGLCYAADRPRRSASAGFTEKIDLLRYPGGWSDVAYNAMGWQTADPLGRVEEGDLRPLPAREHPSACREVEAMASKGTCRQERATTWVSFAGVVAKGGPGVYAAETFVHVPGEADAEFQLYSDNPYRLFVNGTCVKEQGVEALRLGVDLELARPLCFRQAAMVDPPGELRWREGWNHVLLVQQEEPGGSGSTLVFSQPARDSFRPLRAQGDERSRGWNLAGPLRTPLPNVTGNLDLRPFARTPFIPDADAPVDEGATLMGYTFSPEEAPPRLPARLDLRQGEYVVLDLADTLSGCPQLTVSGREGDVLDVVHGERLQDGRIPPCVGDARNVDTLVLGPRTYRWLACAPRGLRYLMLVARQVEDVVRLERPAVVTRHRVREVRGSFECSDTMLNRIWATGRRTLEATVQDGFLCSPVTDRVQRVADAMIQSWVDYHVTGDYALAARSIEDFALTQFETGEMPATCPSGVYANVPDLALLWPVWVQRHFLHSGDKELLGRLSEPLDRFFSYFDGIADPDQKVLGDLGERFGARCFLDHGDIDRRGVVTGLNAIYCRALLSGAWLQQRLRGSKRGAELRRRASRVAHHLRRLCWDSERGLFVDCWGGDGPSDAYSWQSNVLAIYGGIARRADYERIFGALFSDEPPYELLGSGALSNPLFKYFVLETAFAIGRRTWAADMMRYYWGRMLDRGARTWWEFFDPEAEDGVPDRGSLCHGAGVSPSGFLCREVAGISPARPGFTRVFFNPILSAASWVRAKIPTPHGSITAEWQVQDSGELVFVIDADYPLEVIPLLSPDVSESAIIHVSDQVTILASAD